MEKTYDVKRDIKNLTPSKVIILHLLPGILLTIAIIYLAPILRQVGLPSMSTYFLAPLITLIPFELGYLFLQGKKINSKFSLKNIVLFLEKIPKVKIILYGILILLWSEFTFIILGPILDSFMMNTFFNDLPSIFFIGNEPLFIYSKNIRIIIFIFGLIMNGFLAPIVEELYFRGYLLPRMSNLKYWAPLISTVLFSLYHFFSPWQNLTRIIALLPLCYIVWKKRNIYISIFAHCLLNTLGMLFSINYFIG